MTRKRGVVLGLLLFVCSFSVYGIAQDSTATAQTKASAENSVTPTNPNVTGK